MSGIDSLIPRSMYQTDFRQWKLPSTTEVLQKSLSIKPLQRSKYRPVQMDLQILQPFKSDVNVPFSLFHKKKCILQTNPHDPIPDVKLENKIFESKLKARRRRPSVYMTPQISLDRIPEDIMYGETGNEGLASSIYTSDWKKACEFAIKNSTLKPTHEPRNLEFKKEDLLNKSMSETRFKTVGSVLPMELGLEKYIPDWEKQYPVEFIDTTKLFWEKNKKVGLCSVCTPDTTSSKALRENEKTELEKCIEEDSLRTPYALHPPGYTGYVPRLALGIPLRKKTFSKYDQLLTTLMESQGVYKKE